jgi:hypothetical protein
VRGGFARLIAVGVLLGGCDASPGIDAAQVCEAFCDCEAPLSAAHAVCVDDCVADLAGFDIPEPCMECLEEDACAALASCFDSCADPVPRGEAP